jgi:pimeloyl-ACP methyl ester carboxylesterase
MEILDFNRTKHAWMAVGWGLLALLIVLFPAQVAGAHAHGDDHTPKPTVVLVHGAWADGSGWDQVTQKLQREGYPVIVPANPLRSLDTDSEYLASVLAQIPGDIILVGHSYGGAVISNAAAGNSHVKALVYIAAFVPDVGEDILDLGGPASHIPASIEFRQIPPGGPNDLDIYITQDAFRDAFAGDVPSPTAATMAAAQRPLALAAGISPSGAAAWKTIPSWYLVTTNDHAIDPDAQRSMAARAGSNVTEVKSSHAVMISHPQKVVDVINAAARSVH